MVEKAKQSCPENIRNPIANVIKKALTLKGRKPRKSETHIIELVQRIAPTSYLGKALGQVERQAHLGTNLSDSSSDSDYSPSDDSPSSSDSESEQTTMSLSTSSTSSTGSLVDRCRCCHRKQCHLLYKEHRKHRKCSHSKSKKRAKKLQSGFGKLKPIPPTKYDGALDSRAYHQFLAEGAAYIEAGQVDPGKQVFVLSHYLTGKAHEFYIRKVSSDLY